MVNEELQEHLYVWLNTLPPQHTMVWGHDLACPVTDVHAGNIDVVTPDACDAIGARCLVSIVAPGDDLTRDADGFSVVIAPHDTSFRLRHEDSDRIGTTEAPLGLAPAGSNGDVQFRHGWSTAALNKALSGWANRVAGRWDIEWIFDDIVTSRTVARVMQVVHRFGPQLAWRIPASGSDPRQRGSSKPVSRPLTKSAHRHPGEFSLRATR